MRNPPVLIDNLHGNTLARALAAMLGVNGEFKSSDYPATPSHVRIATAYFSPSGFAHLAKHLSSVPDVRLLLGSDLAASPIGERKRLDESRVAFERRHLETGLRTIAKGLERERDHLPFTRINGTALAMLIAALRAGNMQVRRYEEAFLHAKAYIITGTDDHQAGPNGIVVGSSNLTAAGLTQNLELNLGQDDPTIVETAAGWFDELWENAEPYDLAELFEVALQPRSPWEIFIRVLWQLYGDEVEDDAEADESLPLTNFQKHGVARALRLIRETGGAIVADEVGLGKTFIAGEILKIYADRRQRALLICPAALRDSTWRSFRNEYQIFVECLSFDQLAGDIQLRDQQRPDANQRHLQRPLDEYQIVIVDEAHNYRNPDTRTRAATLRRLLFGKKRDLLLLTATPVNNSLWDLYHLIRFFLRQDAHLAGRGIPSIRERFMGAMRIDPANLSPDVLYPIIDATTVKRTRKFVKKHYSGDTFRGPDGQPQTIVFPRPHALTVRYGLEDILPGFFDQLEEALDSTGEGSLLFARYMPGAFRTEADDEEESNRARAMVGLLRSGLLKRFESSAFAFQRTVDKMVREHTTFLAALDAGYVVTTAFIQEISGTDEEVFEELLGQNGHHTPAADYDVGRLRKAVERDRDLLKGLGDAAGSISMARDTKLKALSDALVEIVHQAEDEATDAIDEAQRRKVLVFSFFADTVQWIREFLEHEVSARPELAPYRDRIAVVSGSGEFERMPREDAILGFAPISMKAPAGKDADRYDLLITTDVLAEGVNLQQCRHIINYDLPWNPMRLVQRHGRIDRIGSPHSRVFLRTIFPADRLDQLLNLEQRIQGKLAMAAASVGVVAPIEGAAHGEQVFTETRQEIERLIREDATIFERGGTVSAAQTGEEYRQTLRKALEEKNNRIAQMPWKIGSGMIKGDRSGMFFCAVVGQGSKLERTYLRFIPATEDWLPTDDHDAIIRELGTCLRLIECAKETKAWFPENLNERVYDFWDVAQQDIWTEWMRETDPAYLQPKVRPLNHRVAEFIRLHPPRGMPGDRVKQALDIVESPWPRREEIMLRDWFDTGEQSQTSLAGFLVDRILGTGLEASLPPQPLPPIAMEDIRLLCWMGIEHGTG